MKTTPVFPLITTIALIGFLALAMGASPTAVLIVGTLASLVVAIAALLSRPVPRPTDESPRTEHLIGRTVTARRVHVSDGDGLVVAIEDHPSVKDTSGGLTRGPADRTGPTERER